MALGKTLKALRQKQSLNQKALSVLSGVSQATISRIETGRVRQLRSSALKNIADALAVSVDFLMSDHEVFAHIPSAGSSMGSIPGVSGMREDRFRQIADALDAFAVHENGRILYVNQTLADLLGYRKEELLGKNGIELFVSQQSRPLIQRMINNASSDTYEALFTRKDGSSFPAEITGYNINDNVRLAIIRDIAARRCHQAVNRVQQAGLETESLPQLGKVVRILGDELEDMGLSFESVSLRIIDEGKNLLTSFYALPEARGYRSFQEAVPLQESLDQHAPLRGLISHWHRSKVWEREADAAYAQMIDKTHLGPSYRPELLLDVPFEQGFLGVGLSAQHVRREALVDILSDIAHPISLIVKRLAQLQSLRDQLEQRPGNLVSA
jgi:PAS domain S-box-containing protein